MHRNLYVMESRTLVIVSSRETVWDSLRDGTVVASASPCSLRFPGPAVRTWPLFIKNSLCVSWRLVRLQHTHTIHYSLCNIIFVFNDMSIFYVPLIRTWRLKTRSAWRETHWKSHGWRDNLPRRHTSTTQRVTLHRYAGKNERKFNSKALRPPKRLSTDEVIKMIVWL